MDLIIMILVKSVRGGLPKDLSNKDIVTEVDTKYTGIGLVYLCVGNEKKKRIDLTLKRKIILKMPKI